MMGIEKSHMPYPDEPGIYFPPLPTWKAIIKARKDKYEVTSLPDDEHRPQGSQRNLQDAANADRHQGAARKGEAENRPRILLRPLRRQAADRRSTSEAFAAELRRRRARSLYEEEVQSAAGAQADGDGDGPALDPVAGRQGQGDLFDSPQFHRNHDATSATSTDKVHPHLSRRRSRHPDQQQPGRRHGRRHGVACWRRHGRRHDDGHDGRRHGRHGRHARHDGHGGMGGMDGMGGMGMAGMGGMGWPAWAWRHADGRHGHGWHGHDGHADGRHAAWAAWA